jgi:hypothetical protein
MQIGILGSGTVAQTLARGCLRHGHSVELGTRSPAKLQDFLRQNPGVRLGTFHTAAEFGELVILAVKGTAAEAALGGQTGVAIENKTVIDATNPIADLPPKDGVLEFFTGPNDSLMERLQAAHPRAHFVKAFNSVGADFMVDPRLPGGPPTMFYCGNDDHAKRQAEHLIRQFGWEPYDVGRATSARALEPLCQLWCLPGFLRGDWKHAFKLLR